MTEWPENLVRDIARRRSVIVAGSGVAAQAIGSGGVKPPTWKTFLTECNENAPGGPSDNISKAIADGDLLHACEWLKKKYDYRWGEKLRTIFSSPRFQPNDVHADIAKLDSRINFSLNFDDILDRAMMDIHGGTSITKSFFDPDVSEFLRGTERYLIKVHGSLHAPDRIIFTQRQYAKARIEAHGFYSAFDSALMTHTFLFLGTGYSDPDINLILENQNFTFSDTHPHYFLTAVGMHQDLKESLRKNRNLEVVEFDPIDQNYSGFANAIAELKEAVEIKRSDIASRMDW
jgi:hypothetical protein